MTAIATFVVLVGMLILFNRTFGWVRRALARHRAQWISQGYLENDPAHRLRADRYGRVGMVTYLICGMLLCMLLQESPLASFAPLVVIVSAMFAIVPAYLAKALTQLITEVGHPYGEASKLIRDLQFHRAPQPITPQGEHGTAQLDTPIKVGLLNPVGWMIPARSIVVEVKN